jgi:hypothetical protein
MFEIMFQKPIRKTADESLAILENQILVYLFYDERDVQSSVRTNIMMEACAKRGGNRTIKRGLTIHSGRPTNYLLSVQ